MPWAVTLRRLQNWTGAASLCSAICKSAFIGEFRRLQSAARRDIRTPDRLRTRVSGLSGGTCVLLLCGGHQRRQSSGHLAPRSGSPRPCPSGQDSRHRAREPLAGAFVGRQSTVFHADRGRPSHGTEVDFRARTIGRSHRLGRSSEPYSNLCPATRVS